VLILPVGQSDSTVRRHPVVSYTVIGLCVLVFMVCQATRPGRDWLRQIGEKLGEMIDCLRETPQLELPPILADLCDQECVP
jgi:hypothetical protein